MCRPKFNRKSNNPEKKEDNLIDVLVTKKVYVTNPIVIKLYENTREIERMLTEKSKNKNLETLKP